MTHGTSMRDLCQRLNPQSLRINERKLVQFGLIEGLIRRVYKVRMSLIFDDTIFHFFFSDIVSLSILLTRFISWKNQYPIQVQGPCAELDGDDDEGRNDPVYKYFTGAYSLDEICCNTAQSVAHIEEIVEKDPSVVMLWK